MNYYLCVGLGIFLTLQVLGHADPTYDLGFIKTIAAFFTTLFLWPIELAMQFYQAHVIRKMTNELLKSLNAPLNALESPETRDHSHLRVVGPEEESSITEDSEKND
jgi:hypothetical protein